MRQDARSGWRTTPDTPAGGAGGDAGGRRHVRHLRRRLIEVALSCGRPFVQADQIDMGWFTRDAEADMPPRGSLTADERAALARLEAKVQAGVTATMTMIEAGKALAEIRTRQLFRDSASTWDDYVHAAFKITRRRADQLIAFAGVQAALEETGTAVPVLSERAVRPLVGLSPDTISEIVSEAAETPEGVTATSIRKAASRRRKKAKLKVPRPVRLRVPGAVVEIAFNAKAAAGGFNVEAALQAALEASRRNAEAA